MSREIWVPVVGFVGLYEVSDAGRVRSLPRKTVTGVLGGRILKTTIETNGYSRVTLSAFGRPHRELLHRLVLRMFVGECQSGQECRHLNGNRSDCRLKNLAWGTRYENARDRLAHGTQVDNSGERHGNAKLTDAQAAAIKRARSNGRKLREIAAEFLVSPQTICRIARGRGWTHV